MESLLISTPAVTTEVHCTELNGEVDSGSSDKSREIRRCHAILVRRLSSLSTMEITPPADSFLGEAAEVGPMKEGKRQRPQSLGGEVETQPPAVTPEKRGKEPVYGTMSVTGRSREMEDAVDVRTALCRPEIARGRSVHFFGVFDGHGGAHVAALLSLKMYAIVKEELMCVKRTEEIKADKWREAMRRAFERADEMAMTTCPCGSVGSTCSCDPLESALGGSTAVVAILTPHHIVIGNCGDSRAVLCRDGRAIPVTRDHKPDRPDERARIEALGGRVVFLDGARVQGILAMSRAIGDKYLKPYVMAEPETSIIRRDQNDEFLIIGSDGLWDVATNELACKVVSCCLQEGSPTPTMGVAGQGQGQGQDQAMQPSSRTTMAAMLLTRLALARKSQDNISVIVVDLKRS